MATPLERIWYDAAQGLRVSWYWGQKLLAASRGTSEKLPEKLRRNLPDRARLLRDLRLLLERDWRNIAAGHYRMPELLASPAAQWRRSREFFSDLSRVEARRKARDNSEVSRQMPRGPYPRYYLQNFHYQTDGYLSRRSARLYDHQVEVLFGGAADAMRRQALVPLHDELRRRGLKGTRLLDLACGTGRFLREVKLNYPRLAVTALDLSAFYLEEARRNVAPWSRANVVGGLAEAAPFASESFDVVVAIYLFHELPQKQRRLVASEIARLLKPGGLFIFLDSLQQGDVPDYDGLLALFPRSFHEPYYAGYTRENLSKLFGAAGLDAETRDLAYFSKLATFRKPEHAKSASEAAPFA